MRLNAYNALMSVQLEVAKVSPRRNLYVSDEDQSVWTRAEQLAQPQSLSALVTSLLRRYIEQRQAATDRIVVEIDDSNQAGTTRKAFRGRMLVRNFRSDETQIMQGTLYFAAQGAKGGLALWDSDTLDGPTAALQTYDSFEEAEAEDWDTGRAMGWPRDFLSAISSALGEEYAEEIDL